MTDIIFTDYDQQILRCYGLEKTLFELKEIVQLTNKLEDKYHE